MGIAVTGAVLLTLSVTAPDSRVLKVQETLAGWVQPFNREALPLAVKECNARIAKDNPTVKVQGKFSLAVRRRNETLTKLFNVPPDDKIALVAPVIFTAAIGGPVRGIMACKFEIKDKRLVYLRMDQVGRLGDRVPSAK